MSSRYCQKYGVYAVFGVTCAIMFTTHVKTCNLRALLTKKAEHLYSALHGTNHFKALRHGSHSLTYKEHHAYLYLVSVHQMALPMNVVANI